MVKPNDEAAFWARVNQNGPIPPHRPELGPCWEWPGAPGHFGHGKLSVRGRRWMAHRFAYMVTYGPIPAGMFVCHRCDNPPCVRPDHLFLGTQQINLDDMYAKGRGPTGDRSGARKHPERLARGDRSGARRHPERYQGERNGRARLTAAQVRTIRTRYAAGGVSQSQLGREYGVTSQTIRFIVHGMTWKDADQGNSSYARDFEEAACTEEHDWGARVVKAAALLDPAPRGQIAAD